MMIKFKHWVLEYRLWITAVFLIGVAVVWLCVPFFHTLHFVAVTVGTVISLSYFMLQQHLAEIRLFKELFTEFNDTYNKLNGDLNALDARTKAMPDYAFNAQEERALLYAYFNLCAEESLYYRKGYIYPEVWDAWRNGMAVFYQNRHIQKFWEEERKTNSYYGFVPPGLASTAGKKSSDEK